jgi:hypothetical protein
MQLAQTIYAALSNTIARETIGSILCRFTSLEKLAPKIKFEVNRWQAIARKEAPRIVHASA